MGNEGRGTKTTQDQLEKHSLPGTDQAGKRAGSCEKNDEEDKRRAGRAQDQDQLDEHSLPGTNQAGKP